MQKCAIVVFLQALSLIGCGSSGYELDESSTETSAMAPPAQAPTGGTGSEIYDASDLGSAAAAVGGAGVGATKLAMVGSSGSGGYIGLDEMGIPAYDSAGGAEAPGLARATDLLSLEPAVAGRSKQAIVIGFGAGGAANDMAGGVYGAQDDSQFMVQTLDMSENGFGGSAPCALTGTTQELVAKGCGCTRCTPEPECPEGEICFRESTSEQSECEPDTQDVEQQPWKNIDLELQEGDTSEEPPALI